MAFHALFIGSTGAGKTNAMLFWLRRLFSNRKDIAEKCSEGEGEVEISPRSVSRCLKALTDKGLLQRVGNVYAPTEQARKQPRQDTL